MGACAAPPAPAHGGPTILHSDKRSDVWLACAPCTRLINRSRRLSAGCSCMRTIAPLATLVSSAWALSTSASVGPARYPLGRYSRSVLPYTGETYARTIVGSGFRLAGQPVMSPRARTIYSCSATTSYLPAEGSQRHGQMVSAQGELSSVAWLSTRFY